MTARALAASLSLEEVAKRTAASTVLAFILAWAVKVILVKVTNSFSGLDSLDVAEIDVEKPYTLADVVHAGMQALQEPATVVLPLVAFAHSARTISCAIQIYLEREVLGSHKLAKTVAQNAAQFLARIDNIFGDLTAVATIVFTVWFFLAWRQQLVDMIVKLELQKKLKGLKRGDLERVFVPISSLFSWAVLGCGALSCLHVIGVNISPLLAVGGISGIAIGFGAQAVTSNAISAMNLMLDRPFVVGEEVKLKTNSGDTVVQGIVEEIMPMRTVIRNSLLEPIAIPNNLIAEYIIVNESRLSRSKVIRDFADSRQLKAHLNIKYEDLDKVPAIVEKVTQAFKSSDLINQDLPRGALFNDTTDYGLEISILAHANPRTAPSFAQFTNDILLIACNVIAETGAEFAIRP